MVCVTGGSGFVGQRLVRGLEISGFDIRLLTREKKPTSNQKQYFLADLVDKNISLNGLLDDVSVVYHCAGEIKNTALMHALHVDGTRRLLDEVRSKIKATNKPIHWVQLSSVGSYGKPIGLASEFRVVTETTACNPKGEYEVTKTLADELVLQLASSEPLFSYTILRPSNVIGENMPNQSLLALVSMIKKRLFFYIGSRSAVATYIHVDDVVAALMKCGTDFRARGQVFNLSNDCAWSEIVFAIANGEGVKPPNLCLPQAPLRILVKLLSRILSIPLTQERIDALVSHTYYSTNKIKAVLGFVPQDYIPSAIASIFKEK